MTVVTRPPTDAITDFVSLDDELARLADEALASISPSFNPDSRRDMRGATLHGAYTDLRQRIAAAVEEAREDAARVAEEERAEAIFDRHGEEPADV